MSFYFQFLLGVYIFFVVCILGAEIAGGVYAFVTKDSLIDEFTSIAENYIKNKYNDSGNPDDSGWNYAMVVVGTQITETTIIK